MSEHEPKPSQDRGHGRIDPRLIGLNAGLLVVLGVVAWGNAQPSGAGSQSGARPRGEYTFVAGRMQGASADAVYILDGTNRELAAIKWNRSRAIFEAVGHRDLAADALYFRQPR